MVRASVLWSQEATFKEGCMTAPIRCAIYTRKSSEEGLEQSFNSLDAQREACEAFILSQRHEGWQPLSARYDDGGFSGGNMERPALTRLMTDIVAGKVNTVVVYKVDRLTRSLADFAKIIEQFDARKVSFVSVTQQFNSTSSMGRLTLNVLLSFAQFEREVTGERIRDKIAASKRKGMWMGGRVPLGYDLRDRKLYINADEAKKIREIFDQYLSLGCVSSLKEHLDKGSMRSKLRPGDRRRTGGERFSRGALYKLLRNHLYVGEIAHKGAAYPGEHEAIIDRKTWERVQRLLEENHQGDWTRSRSAKPSLLTGLVFDLASNRYIPTHAQKNGRRYRYYTSQAAIRKGRDGNSISRVPAPELERGVMERIAEFLRSPIEILDAAKEVGISASECNRLLKRAGNVAQEGLASSKMDQADFLKGILDRVIIHSDSAQVRLNAVSLFRSILGEREVKPEVAEAHLINLSCSLQSKFRGGAIRVVVGNVQPAASETNLAILKAVARARSWYEQIVSGEVSSIPELARQHGVTPRYVKKILPCALLRPNIVEAIVNRECPSQLTLSALTEEVSLDWTSQKEIIA
jgi:site-specific DNA recombinase